MGNLKVSDAEYNDFAKAVKNAGEIAESKLESYFSILGAILENAVAAGDVHTNLALFADNAQVLKGIVGNLCSYLNADAGDYVTEIDAKDEYLY